MAAKKSGYIETCLKFMIVAAALLLPAAFMPSECLGLSDFEMATVLAERLGDEFNPESLSVKVLDIPQSLTAVALLRLGGIAVATDKT
jgi:hypothetical protein